MKPVDVNQKNEYALWQQQYVEPYLKMKKHKSTKKFKFNEEDTVRISYLRNVFTREYEEKWTTEIFTVSKRYFRRGIPVYKLKDYAGEDVQGTFYEEELQLIQEPEVFRIEKVLKVHNMKGQKQSLVRWAG